MALQTLSLGSDAYLDYTLHDQVEPNSQELSTIRIRNLKALKLFNFKSFSGEHYIGPFTDFTGVIGPNGGGKSNVLDAISFALGLSIRDLRCANPEELIYSRYQYNNTTIKKQKEDEENVVMYVEVHFTSNIQEAISIRRVMNANGDSAVFLRGKQISDEEFAIFMLNSKIHVAARNFILLQGEAESLSVSTPAQLTELFERLSGSTQYRREYDQLEKKQLKISSEIRDLLLQRAGLKQESRKLKELRQTSIQYKQLRQEISELRVKVQLLQLYRIDQEIRHQRDNLEELEKGQKSFIENKNQIISEIQNNEMMQKQLGNKINDMKKQIKLKKTELLNMESQDKQAQQELKFIVTYTSTYEQNIQKINKDIVTEENMLKEINLDMENLQGKLQDVEDKQKIKIPEQWQTEYAQLQDDFQKDHFKLQSEIRTLEQQKTVIDGLVEQSDQVLKQVQTQYNTLNSQLTMEQGEMDQLNSTLTHVTSQLNEVQYKIQDLEKDYQIQQKQIEKLIKTRQELEIEITNYEHTLADHIEEEEARHIVQQLTAQVPRFIGELSGLINPVSQQWANALKLAIGQRMLQSLVVQDTNTALVVNKFLKSVQSVKDLIILDKVKHQDKLSELRQRVEAFVEKYRKDKTKGSKNGRGILAVDAIECDKNIENLIAHLLRGTVLTDSYPLAIEIQKAEIPGVYQIITIDGVQLQQGLIVSHTRFDAMRNFRSNNTRGTVKHSKDTISRIQKQLEDTQQNLRNLRISPLEIQVKELSRQKLELEEQKTTIHVQINYRERQIKLIKEQYIPLQIKLDQLKDEQKQKTDQLQIIEKNLKSKLSLLESISGQFYQSFSQKSGITKEQLLAFSNVEQLIKQKDSINNSINRLKLQENQIRQRIRTLNKKIEEIKTDIISKREAQQQKIIGHDELKKESSQLRDQIHELSNEEAQLEHKEKQINKQMKELIEKRDKTMRKNIEYVQNRTNLMGKFETAIQEKAKLLEECEMESIEIKFKLKDEIQQDQTVDYSSIVKDLEIDEPNNLLDQYQRKIEAKEKDQTKYLSENLQLSLIGGKTDEKYDKIESQIKEISEKLHKIYDQEHEIQEALKTLKTLRAQKFTDLFKKVSEEIGSLYKSLTFQEQTQLGGSALLYLENQNEPYNGGVIYTTTPPNKKYVFDTSEQLSGGEKTMASVALLLALNSVLASPFILLDEIDANLDPDNARRLRLVVQALAGKPTQFIVISHNPEVFGKAQSLIGVTIQAKKQTSESFSMLL